MRTSFLPCFARPRCASSWWDTRCFACRSGTFCRRKPRSGSERRRGAEVILRDPRHGVAHSPKGLWISDGPSHHPEAALGIFDGPSHHPEAALGILMAQAITRKQCWEFLMAQAITRKQCWEFLMAQ